ncbi:terpenoid cyclases/protein prenyltransferase alpha-alpha toroid [Podospora appendiculata]|uniref:Terpenoid cyclases/protein prenyltransferase alpha-alpha toroid n=1 Tax=Podospora appendiculata TaxID=314037 RepID=A0AAE0XCA1_9PEZI|nr:terpenoid cyclases/protein prenyltransferase alpha-alpha toroid [Podospora appendiculata]
MAAEAAGGEPSLDIERHLKYWKMCLRSPLPHAYLSNEGNRMALAYFIINSISILTPSSPPPPSSDTAADKPPTPPLIGPEERRALRQWVLSHQHAAGGFCGTSSLIFPLRDYEEWDFEAGAPTQEHSGLANIAATLFALQLLALLADDETADSAFSGVDRVRTLRWLRRLQRDDGSFGEVLRLLPGRGWFIGGGYDMRYCYIATAVRWMLRGHVKAGEPGWVDDFDTAGLARYILTSQTYDGGFAGSSQDEPHAGYAYCAIGALSLLDRPLENSKASHPSAILHSGIRDMPRLIHWLASRQFVYLEPDTSADDDDDDDDDDAVNFLLPKTLSDLSLDENLHYAGFNGRCNKVADTCYCWWVGGALANLGREELLPRGPSRRFLLEKMQHRIGGFGKYPGSPPDLYHACFGLAILAVMGEPGLSPFDSSLAVPVETVRRIERARRGLLKNASEERKAGTLGRELVNMGLALSEKTPEWLVGVTGGAW